MYYGVSKVSIGRVVRAAVRRGCAGVVQGACRILLDTILFRYVIVYAIHTKKVHIYIIRPCSKVGFRGLASL